MNPDTVGLVPHMAIREEEFRSRLEDQTTSVATYLDVDSEVMQVAFGGIAGMLHMPPFEFFRVSSDFPTKKVFVRDLSQSWYHGELPGIGHGVDELAAYLLGVRRQQDVKRSVFIGSSMGGYAAILLGMLLNVDSVLAFAPQTFINRWNRVLYRDRRWPGQIARTYRWRSATPAYYDLRSVVAKRMGGSTRVAVFVGINDRLDRMHAHRLRGLTNVTVHQYDVGGHALVRHLRDSGVLRAILEEALSIQRTGSNSSAGV